MTQTEIEVYKVITQPNPLTADDLLFIKRAGMPVIEKLIDHAAKIEETILYAKTAAESNQADKELNLIEFALGRLRKYASLIFDDKAEEEFTKKAAKFPKLNHNPIQKMLDFYTTMIGKTKVRKEYWKSQAALMRKAISNDDLERAVDIIDNSIHSSGNVLGALGSTGKAKGGIDAAKAALIGAGILGAGAAGAAGTSAIYNAVTNQAAKITALSNGQAYRANHPYVLPGAVYTASPYGQIPVAQIPASVHYAPPSNSSVIIK